ncbi:unnamed protein product [Arctogadus glacialis]
MKPATGRELQENPWLVSWGTALKHHLFLLGPGSGPELRLLRAACPYMVIYVTRPAPYLMRRPGVPVPVQWNRSARLFFTHCLSPSPHKQTITTSHCHQMNDKLT